MELAGLVESPEHVCARYRLALFAPILAAAGVNLTLHARPPSTLARLNCYRRLRDSDAVVVQRVLPTRAELQVLRRYARTLIFDFDDAIWLRDSYHPRGLRSAKRERRFRAMVSCADAVVAGNAFLAEAAARFTSAHRVHIIPTCVDPNHYPIARHTATGAAARLTWIGSGSTIRGLMQADELFDAIGTRLPGIRLRVICDQGLTLKTVPVDVIPWSESTEGAALAAADVGISWVPDDDWSRGKCGLKLVQYLAAGLPAVANPVGVHADVLGPEAGLLAATPAEWAEAVEALAANPTERERRGSAGRARIAAQFSAAAGARRWLGVLGRAPALC